jgi:hypothetical protein
VRDIYRVQHILPRPHSAFGIPVVEGHNLDAQRLSKTIELQLSENALTAIVVP